MVSNSARNSARSPCRSGTCAQAVTWRLWTSSAAQRSSSFSITSPLARIGTSSEGALRSEILVGVLVATIRGAVGSRGPTAAGLLVPERERPRWTTPRVSPISSIAGDDPRVVMGTARTPAWGLRSGLRPRARLGNLAHGLLDRAPSLDAHELALEVLVDGEELLDLLAQRQWQVLEPFVRVPVGVVQGNADDLVVASLLVVHLEHSQRLDRNQAAGERRLVQAHERVQRVSVRCERAAQVSVV